MESRSQAYAMILDANLGFQASSLLFDSVPVPAAQEASAGPTSLEEVADWLLSRAPRRFLVAPNGDVEVVGDQS